MESELDWLRVAWLMGVAIAVTIVVLYDLIIVLWEIVGKAHNQISLSAD